MAHPRSSHISLAGSVYLEARKHLSNGVHRASFASVDGKVAVRVGGRVAELCDQVLGRIELTGRRRTARSVTSALLGIELARQRNGLKVDEEHVVHSAFCLLVPVRAR